jgi:DNA-binding transcriptional LysR family regulator
MDKFNQLRIFCRIVELGSFAAVAREMKVSAMQVSKVIAQLEKTLGVVLLSRTTRSVNLTEAGHLYYRKGRLILEELEELDESTKQLGESVKGILKLCAPIDFGSIFMVSVIEAYQQRFPDVKISLTLENKHQNLREGLYDISILVTDKLDPGVVARKIYATSLGTYASPEYLAQYGEPQTPKDLVNHRCLHYMDTPHGEYWVFNDKGDMIRCRPDWCFSSNNGRALSQAALLGMGIVRSPELSVADYLRQGRLVEILSEYRLPELSVYATYLQKKFYPGKLTTFVEFMLEYFSRLQSERG